MSEKYIGDFKVGQTIRFKFNTSDTLAGATLSVYKDNGTTEVTTGVVLTADFDSRADYHLVVITTTADLAFYAAGSDFDITITAGTVGGVSAIGQVVRSFSIENRSVQNVITDTEDIQSRLPAALQSGRMDSYVGSMGAGTLTATAIANGALDSKGNWNIGKTGYTLTQSFPSNFAALGINASGHISRVTVVDTNTDMRGTDSALLAINYTTPPTAAAISSQVASDLQTAHGAGSWTTATGFSTLDAAGVRSAIGLATANLDDQLLAIDNFLDTEIATGLAILVKLDTMLVLDGAVYQLTANSLELSPGGGGGGGDATLANQELILTKLELLRGPGDSSHSMLIQTAAGIAIPQCTCWVSTDEEGDNVITDNQVTNSRGEVEFLLDAGTYYLFRQKDGYTFTNPQEFTVG